MNRIFGHLLLAVITFNLGLTFAKFGRRPAARIDRNAISLEVKPQLPPPKPIAVPVPETYVPAGYHYGFRTESIREQVPGQADVTIEYPQLIKPSGRREVAFNRFLAERMRKSYVASSNFRRVEVRKRARRNPGLERPLKITYEVVYADARIVSLKFVHRVAMAGKLDPIDHPETLNYDLAQGRPIKLSDLFRPGSGYLPVIDAYSRGILEERFGDEFDAGYLPVSKESTFEHWNLSPEGLMISVDAFQLGVPLRGQPVVIIPYEMLWDLTGSQSLIDRFIDHC